MSEAADECKAKFVPTYKVSSRDLFLVSGLPNIKNYVINILQIGIMVWPILQTINFAMVPERNRLIYVSICSLMWTIFLAYAKRQETIGQKKMPEVKCIC